jgi:plastocyanin
VTVSGLVSGGGTAGPGGAVVWLKKAEGATPRPTPLRGKVVSQVNKSFVPRILPVPVGSTVSFANQDPIFHNIFSLSRPNDFDSGLFKAGQSYSKTFSKPGPVQLLCNIHASMLGYVVVVDSPWYGQADASGAFAIRGVPPGQYDLESWHEGSSQIGRQRISVGAEGLRGVAVRVSGDRRAPAAVPDKYGKDRQLQLGY